MVPEPGFYYHYKHDPVVSVNNYSYEVLHIGHYVEEDIPEEIRRMVVYRPLYKEAYVYREGKLWDLRPLSVFMSSVVKNGREVTRFSRITDKAILEKLQSIRDELYS